MDRNEIFSHLKKAFVFASLEESEVARIALRFKPVRFKAGKIICRQGEELDSFYILDKGKVHLFKGSKRGEKLIGNLTGGDFYGAKELLKNKSCFYTMQAETDGLLFYMKSKDFTWMLQTYPRMKEDLQGFIKSYSLGWKKQFKWLNPDEVIHILARKHIALLWYELPLPIIIGGFGVVLETAALFMQPAMAFLNILGVISLLVAALLAMWIIVDWGNDYYIVTNQRVVWLEKVIGLYDSRQESPLDAVLSVNVTSDQAQRVMGTGDVIVRTYTGSIIMKNVDRPEQFAMAVNAFWKRSKETSELLEREEIEEAIRERLYGRGRTPSFESDDIFSTKPTPVIVKKKFLARLFGNFFKTRYVEGDNITYRKHWYVLLQKTWKPLLVFIIVSVVVVFLYLPVRETKYAFVAGTTALIIWGIVYLLVLLWWLYDYLDWRNDIYVLTVDKLFDIERKPLGREEKKVAPLESVLSLEHTREGILGLLLNFGNVIINVGSAKLVFYGVHNPALVQHDIFNRMYELKQLREHENARREREKMLDWLTIYQRESENKKKKDENSPDFY